VTDPIPFALPHITELEIARVSEVLRSGWITTGPRVKEFEQRFAHAVGAAQGVAVNSCTAAMHLALEAIGITGDDEVIVPTMTFAATGEVVRYLGARPVLVDIRADDHNLDPAALARAITPRTKAILPVHFGGQACAMDEVLEIARAHGLAVVEDAAHAFPTRYQGRLVGSLGDITCFSFYATKTITTAEGGMAVANREDWVERMRVMSLHGISQDAWNRYSAEGSWYYEIVAPGFKYNMTDIAAALGLAQLERAGQRLERRRQVARVYSAALQDDEALELLQVRSFDEHAWHLFVIKLAPGVLSIDRGQLIEELKELGIGASVHFIPLHLHPYYRKELGWQADDLPVARDCYERSVSLPIYSRMTEAQAEQVAGAIGDLTRRYRR
jgi:perosamine synthetase